MRSNKSPTSFFRKIRGATPTFPPSIPETAFATRWIRSERTAARLTNAQLKESDLTGEMMRPFREAQARHWYVSGIVLRPELAGTRAIRVLLGDGLSHWIYTAAITFPFQLLALASSKEGELLLARFGFYCYQKAHAS
jgi:hypothetical protein